MMDNDSIMNPVPDADDAIEEFDFRNQKDAILYCIEVSPSMLATINPADASDGTDPTCAARIALESAYMMLQQRIISQPSDAFGILLYGTKEQTDPAYENCLMLMDLAVPEASEIKHIKEILEDDEKFDSVFTPSDTPPSIVNTLFCANQQFNSNSGTYMFQRLFLVTNNDNPSDTRPDYRKSARTRLHDLIGLGVRIEPFFLYTEMQPFDTSKFWEDVIFGSYKSDDYVDIQPILITAKQGLQTKAHVKARQTPRHAIFSVPLEIVPGKLSIGVKGYVLFKRQDIQRSHYVYEPEGDRAIIARSHAQYTYTLDETGTTATFATRGPKGEPKLEEIEKNAVNRGFKFGGEVVPFSQDEIQSLRNIGEAGIRIIGFKPLQLFDPSYNMRQPYFIYPSEEDYVGSIRTFAALHSILLDENKYAVAWVKATTRSSPFLAALIACQEIIERENGRDEQKQSPGIFVIRQPFADDIRDFPVQPNGDVKGASVVCYTVGDTAN
ncbi:SPOC like C-terminal domain-containing protein [Lipomyces kononenkoae]|uniref:SPOC like C-terminal domain-containing protein n=1 Tax=Lipomyces kononenkoae TaxID=34357 RepID=A0ACC3ST60_LIPKO